LLVRVLGVLIALAVALYTADYGWEVWRRHRNHAGAIAVFILAMATVGMPIYMLFIRK
jgi:hypothetical protein